jgi:hypothetical protein
MANEWIGLIGTIAGGILVGTVTYIFRRKELMNQRRTDEEKFRRSQLEKVHFLITRADYAMRDFFTEIALTRFSHIDMSEKLRIFARERKILDEPLAEIHSLLAIYAPELVGVFLEAFEGCTEITGAAPDFLNRDGSIEGMDSALDKIGLKWDLIRVGIEEKLHRGLEGINS